MTIAKFEYAKPLRLIDAINLLADNPDAVSLAGGQTLLPTLKQRLSRPALLVNLDAIAEMKGISVNESVIIIGAMTRHADTAMHEGIRKTIPALSYLAGGIAHPQVRRMGTMGGSVANNDPAADYPAAVLGLGATIETTRRKIKADDFFLGLFQTALEPGELIVKFHFPVPDLAGYHKFANPASGYVTSGCFVSKTGDQARVAVNGAGPCVFRDGALEAVLGKCFEPDQLTGCKLDDAGLNNDIHASASYRAHLAVVAARRAVEFARENPKKITENNS